MILKVMVPQRHEAAICVNQGVLPTHLKGLNAEEGLPACNFQNQFWIQIRFLGGASRNCAQKISFLELTGTKARPVIEPRTKVRRCNQ